MLIYFLILFILGAIPFWVPELGWSSQFLIAIVAVDALSGALFPINILPKLAQSIVLATPVPYLIYFPIEAYLGNVSGWGLVGGLLVGASWVGVLWITLSVVWKRGLKSYQAFGR